MQALSDIDQMLADRDYSQAMSALGSLDSGRMSPSEYGYFCILLTEASLYHGVPVADCVDAAIEIFRHDLSSDLFARAKYAKGWQLMMQSDFPEAREHLIESYAGYLRFNKKSRVASALNLTAFVDMHLGNPSAGLLALERAASLQSEAGRKDRAFNALTNKATLLGRIGRLIEARALYRELEGSVDIMGPKSVANFYTSACLSECLAGQFKRASSLLGKAEEYFESFPREHAVALEVYGKLETLRGNLPEAEKYLLEGLKLSLTIAPESALISQTKRLLADVYIAQKKFDRAKQVADEALAVATKINERLEIAACWRIFGQIEAHHLYRDRAREWFHKAIDMLVLIDAQYDLAVTRLVLAESGTDTVMESRTQVELAREYFEREQVAPYLEETEQALRALTLQRPKAAPVVSAGQAPVVVSQSRAMQTILEKIEYVAPSNINILLLGETGTGKDLIARWIHHMSGRTGEFVSVNAAAIPDHLFESELFGHTRGAYTGADRERNGLIEQAVGGTFYLNEIAETSPAIQAKLLEVIENKRLRRLGENNERLIDFRLIAATNRDLTTLVQENKFRADLYHRLNEIPITLPPLRTRSEDIAPLVVHFLQMNGADGDLARRRDDIARLSKTLSSRIWPGNVRELQAEVRRLWVESHGEVDRMLELVSNEKVDTERRELVELLEACGGNRREMARRLNVSDSTIRYRLRKFNIDVPESVSPFN